MKFSTSNFRLSFTLILTAILLTSTYSFHIRTRSEKATKLQANNELKFSQNATAAAGNGTADNSTPGSNVVGKNDLKSRIQANPYQVNKCDQIVQFQAQTLDDLNNFNVKSTRYYTLSMYSIAQFTENKPTAFENLITIGAIQTFPSIITGSVSCIKFESYYKNIIICLNSKEEANNLMNAYKSFMKCRMGDNLSKPIEKPADKIKNIINKACMGLDISFDDSKFKNPVEAEAALNMAINSTLKKLADSAEQFYIYPNNTSIKK